MNRRKLLQVMAGMTVIMLFLVGCSAPVGTPTPIVIVVTATPQATARATPAPPTVLPVLTTPTHGNWIYPIVVDTSGKKYEVMGLKAKYVWTSGTPGIFTITNSEIKESLFIVLVFVKDRVTTTEELEIPFASMQRVVFAGASLPEKFKEKFKGQVPIRIDMRDGTVILLSWNLLVEMDAKGNQTKEIEFDKYSLEADTGYFLDGFSGRGKTENGKEGDFWIPEDEVQSIEFEQP